MTAPVVDLHADCEQNGQLYGTEFCLATRKPGPCKGAHRPGTPTAPPPPVKQIAVPNAPTAKTPQQLIAERQAADTYTQAYLHAQALATTAGVSGQRHAGVQAAVGDYARALHQHGQAIAADDRARAHAQRAHDSAVARNKAYAASAAAAQARTVAHARAHAARTKLKKAVHVAKFPLTYPAPAGFASDDWADIAELYALPGAQFEELYALTAAAHWMCGVDQFCRNPLHPGPCKGWKHTLHAVAPGAFHAYEKQRVDKLNAYRKARIKALQEAGQPVPKSLLKEITYKIPTAPQAGFTPPTSKEAQQALPATAKEIAAKLAMKHADIAAAKLDGQHAALMNVAQALGQHPDAGTLKKKLADISASQKAKGEPITAHPVVHKTIGNLAGLASQKAGGLNAEQKAQIHEDIAQHVEHGIPGTPLLVQSALNVAKKKAQQTAQDAVKAAPDHKPVTSKSVTDAEFLAMDAVTRSKLIQELASAGSKHKAGTAAHEKAKAKVVHLKKLNNDKNAADAAAALKAKSTAQHGGYVAPHIKTALDYLNGKKVGLPTSLVLSDVAKDQYVKHFTPDQRAKALAELIQIHKGMSPGASDRKSVERAIADLQDIDAQKPAGTPPSQSSGALAHPDMMHAVDTLKGGFTTGEKLHSLSQPGVTKAEFDKLGSGKKAVVDALAEMHDAAPAKVQNIAHKLGIDKLDVMIQPGNAAGHGPGLAAEAKQIMNQPNKSLITKASELTSAHIAAMPEADKEALAAKLDDIGSELSPTLAKVAGDLHAKLTGKTGPAVQAITPAAPLGPDVAPHVKAAQSVATGATHMTDTKKLDAYAKLTQAEYHSLPWPVQDKIHTGLLNAHAKFLSPAKKDAAKSVLDKLGPPKETPQGAGAPHAPGSPLEASQADHLGAMAQAAAAAGGLAHGTSMSTEHKELQVANAKTILEEHPADSPLMLATGYAFIWMKKHNIPDQVGPGLDMAVQDKAVAEFKHMIETGQKTPPKGGVLEAVDLGLGAQAVADAAGVHAQSSQAGGGVVSPLQHAQAHAAVYELAKGVPLASVMLDGWKKLYTEHPAHETADDVAGVYAKKWAEKHLENLGLTPGQRSEITAKAETEMHDMVMKGQLFPPPHGVLEAAVAGHSPSELAAALKTAAGLPGGGPAAPAVEPGTKLGKGTAITKIPADVKAGILSAFKALPNGKYLADQPEDILQNVINLAHAYGKPGSLMSLAQVLNVIDETQAKKLGVSNAGLMEAKIKDWLATPEGAKLAKKIKAQPTAVEALKAGKPVPFTPPPGVTIGKGAKVQKVGGPGKFDGKVPSAKFKIHTVSEARAEQAATMSKTGQKWTAAQSSALTGYTSYSGGINNYLRGKDSGSAQIKQQVVDIQSAMMPLTHHHLLTRGTGFDQLPEDFRDPLKAKNMIGKTFQEPAFLSSSVDGAGFTSKPLILEIEAPPGTMGAFVEDISDYKGGQEKEMLLAAGTKMKVLSVRQQNGRTIMRVRVVS